MRRLVVILLSANDLLELDRLGAVPALMLTAALGVIGPMLTFVLSVGDVPLYLIL